MTAPLSTSLLSVDQAKSQLRPGTIEAIYSDDKDFPGYSLPRLQIIHIKKLNANQEGSGSSNSDRFRVILSDGSVYFQAMLGIALNDFANGPDPLIKLYSLITLRKFTCSSVRERRILIVLDIVTDDIHYVDNKIGTPINVDELSPKGKALEQPLVTPTPIVKVEPSSSLNPYAIAPIMNKPSTSNCNSVASLSPYQNKWTIKVRVTAKSEIKTWTNQKGQGKLFSVTLMDSSGEIRATAFNDTVDLYFTLFEVGKCYEISNGQIKLAKKQFSNVNNDYELHFDKESLVKPIEDNSNSVPTIKFNFGKISDLVSFNNNEFVDVVGIVKDVGELGSITVKATQKQISKRDVHIVDMSLHSVKVTFWGKQAEEMDHNEDWQKSPVVAIKGAKVSDYNGRSLSVSNASVCNLNPDISLAHELRGWYDTMGKHSTFTSISSGALNTSMDLSTTHTGTALEDRKTIQQIRDEGLGNNIKPDYVDMMATLSFIKADGPISYAACPGTSEAGTPCLKKLNEIGPSLYRCEKCARNYDAPLHRYILSLTIADETGSTWVNAFNEVAETILANVPASDLLELKEGNPDAYNKIIKDATFKTYVMRLRIKNEMYQGESKAKHSIVSLSVPDYEKESSLLSQTLLKMTPS